MNGAELLVAALENEGVTHIFGVPGEENLDIVEALRRSTIKLVVTRHEQAAAFMAATHGRLTGEAGEQGPLKLQIAGLATPHEQTVLRGDPEQGGFSVFCFRGTELAGVKSVNRPLDHMLARRLLASGAGLTPEQAADPGFDLKGTANAPKVWTRERA